MTNESLRARFVLPESKAETVSRVIRDTLDSRLIKNASGSQSKRYRRYIPFWG
jgi:ATP-dependent DNA helicase RecG